MKINNRLYFYSSYDEFVGIINFKYNNGLYIAIIRCDGVVDCGEYHITNLKIAAACKATIPISSIDENGFKKLSSKEKAKIDFSVRNAIIECFRNHDYVPICLSRGTKDLSEEMLNKVKNLPEASIDQLKEISNYDKTVKDYVDFKLALEKL